MAAWLGRGHGRELELGVCGEHGGDPDSIDFFAPGLGIDYVSCSPYRVPIARVAAAQSAIRARARVGTSAAGEEPARAAASGGSRG